MGDTDFPASFSELNSRKLGFYGESIELDSAEVLCDKLDEWRTSLGDQCTLPQEFLNHVFTLISNLASLEKSVQNQLIECFLTITREMLRSIDPQESCSASERVAIKQMLYLLASLSCKAETVFQSSPSPTASGRTKENKEADDGDGSESEAAVQKPKKRGTVKVAKATSGVHWTDFRTEILVLLVQSLSLPPTTFWTTGKASENFLLALWTYGLQLLETRPVGLAGVAATSVANRDLALRLITGCVNLFGRDGSSNSFCAALLDSLTRQEHMSAFAVEIVAAHQGKLLPMIFMEISEMNMTAAANAKNVSSFLELVCKNHPQMVARHFVLIKQLADSPAHQIRSALFSGMGSIISHAHTVLTAGDCYPADPSALEDGKRRSSLRRRSASHRKSVSKNDEEDEVDSEDLGGDDVESVSEEQQQQGSLGVSLDQSKQLRDAFLDILTERVHDKNPYTRSNVLKVWHSLVTSSSLPMNRFTIAAEVAVDRLMDRTATVRKNAVNLLTEVIQFNPYGANLSLSVLLTGHQQLGDKLTSRIQQLRLQFTEANADAKELESCEDEEAKRLEEEIFLSSPLVQADEDLSKLRSQLTFLNEAVNLARVVGTAVAVISNFIASKTASDVVEAARFLTKGTLFQVEGCMEKLQKAFSLIWSSDTSIKQEILSSFISVYLSAGDGGELTTTPSSNAEIGTPLTAEEMTTNLVELTRRCVQSEDRNELASLEAIIGELFRRGQGKEGAKEASSDFVRKNLDKGVLTELWQRLVRIRATEFRRAEDCATAAALVRLVYMIAKCSAELLTVPRFTVILQAAQLESLVRDPSKLDLVSSVALCLQLAPSSIDVSTGKMSPETSQQWRDILYSAVPALRTVLLGQEVCRHSEAHTRKWFACAEEAAHALFNIHPTPEKVMAGVVVDLYSQLQTSAVEAQSSDANKLRLTRLLFVLGQTALNSLTYVERLAATSKKAGELRSKSATEKPSAGAEIKSKPTEKKSSKKKSAEEETDCHEDNAMEVEMGLAASVDADHEMAYNNVVENELVVNNLLGQFHQLVAFVALNTPCGATNAILKESSVLALCRFMAVSSVMCERYLPVLFTILTQCADPRMKTQASPVVTTILIALGDLAFRFPNAVEPWTANIYDNLLDESPLIRYNTLTVLTHLILNDMIKLKGQVTNIVYCLSDDNPVIRDLATQMFQKLSERSNNPVYNLLGDVIGQLVQEEEQQPEGATESNEDGELEKKETITIPVKVDPMGGDMDGIPVVPVVTARVSTRDGAARRRSLSKKKFQQTLSFLLSFVKKDKQADGLLERLLVRLSLSQSVRQSRQLSYCCSLLIVSDKGLKKILDAFKTIKSALYDEEVYGNMVATVKAAKKSLSGTKNVAAAAAAQAEDNTPPTTSTSVGGSGNAKGIVEELDALFSELKICAEGQPREGQEDETAAVEGNDENADTANTREPPAKATKSIAKKPARGARTTKTTTRKAPSAKSKRSKRISEESSDDENNDGEDSLSDGDEVDAAIPIKHRMTGREAINSRSSRKEGPVVAAVKKRISVESDSDEAEFSA